MDLTRENRARIAELIEANKRRQPLTKDTLPLTMIVPDIGSPWFKGEELLRKLPEAYLSRFLYLGMIPNCADHCAVVDRDGKVIWMAHHDQVKVISEQE